MKYLAILLMLISSTAYAGGCRSFFHANQIVAKQAVSYQVAPLHRVYYSVGQALQSQAAVTQSMKADPLYDEFQQFLRFKAYKQGLAASGNTQAVKQTLISQKCAKCHGAGVASPKGETFILDENSAETIVKALRQIRDNKMPPNAPLSNEEKAAIMQELLESEN